jgi:hypothetical protein
MGDIATNLLILPGLFISCIQSFEIIQYGRAFESDHYTLTLRLDYIGVTLARWGKAVKIVGRNNITALEGCRPFLENIKARFVGVKEKVEASQPSK